MNSLVELIEKEGNRNNVLKDALEQGSFPSDEVAKEIGGTELYRIATNSVEFRFRTQIAIIQSNYYFAKLVGLYLAECEENSVSPKWGADRMKSWVEDYNQESENKINELTGQQMKGYESGW